MLGTNPFNCVRKIRGFWNTFSYNIYWCRFIKFHEAPNIVAQLKIGSFIPHFEYLEIYFRFICIFFWTYRVYLFLQKLAFFGLDLATKCCFADLKMSWRTNPCPGGEILLTNQRLISTEQDRSCLLLTVVIESSLAQLGSGSSRFFLLLLEKLEPKKSEGLIWLNWKKIRLEKLDISEAKKLFFKD
jgi:hypothetical protein